MNIAGIPHLTSALLCHGRGGGAQYQAATWMPSHPPAGQQGKKEDGGVLHDAVVGLNKVGPANH